MKKKLSILVTVYNNEKYLEKCLDSLVRQSLKEIEIICVNDGSTDGSLDILNRYAAEYPESVIVYTKENGGEWGARNYGIQRITAEYFVFVDGDDYVHEDFALRLYTAVDENNADMAVCAFDRIDADTNKITCTDMNAFGYKVFPVDSRDSILAFINPAAWNKVFRANKVRDIEYQEVRPVGTDLLFLLTAVPRLEKIVFIPDSLYFYMIRRDSMIHGAKKFDLDAYERRFLKLKELYTSSAAYTEFMDYLNLVVFMHYGMATIFRLSYSKSGAALQHDAARITAFLNTEFSGWRTSPFLKFSYSLKKGVKHMSLYAVSLLYKMNMSLLFVRIYKFVVDVLRIDVKY